MFKPLAIKEITNPKQEKVIRIGGDGIYEQVQFDTLTASFVGSFLSLYYVITIREFRPPHKVIIFPGVVRFSESPGTADMPGMGGIFTYGYAVLRGGSMIDVENGDGDKILQYPES